jgi:hypothetical protein
MDICGRLLVVEGANGEGEIAVGAAPDGDVAGVFVWEGALDELSREEGSLIGIGRLLHVGGCLEEAHGDRREAFDFIGEGLGREAQFAR